jgi:tRNA(Ile)-lysidine synthase
LQELSAARQRNVLRRAIRLAGLPPPPATRLYQIVHELLPARSDAQPLVAWSGVEVRRFRDDLYILAALRDLDEVTPGILLPGAVGLPLGPAMGSLALIATAAAGIDPSLARQGLKVCYRDGGEELRVDTGGPTRKLKKLLQEYGVVPWMRQRIPLLYAGGRLVAVANLWVEADCLASPGLHVEWHDCPALK